MSKDLDRAACREMNVAEEIETLPIDEKVKARIVKKAKADMDKLGDMSESIYRYYDRIRDLENACVELCIMLWKNSNN